MRSKFPLEFILMINAFSELYICFTFFDSNVSTPSKCSALLDAVTGVGRVIVMLLVCASGVPVSRTS